MQRGTPASTGTGGSSGRMPMRTLFSSATGATCLMKDADAYTVLLRHRRHLFDEVGEVLPDLFIAELAPVRQRLRPRFPIPHSGLIGAGHVELPRRGAAYHGATARPDAVAHVRIGRIVDTGLAEVANILL